MIHARMVKPRIFPWESEREPEQINRAQDIGQDFTTNKEKKYEIGRDGILAYKKNTPSVKYTLKQFEYGAMEFWYSLANKETPASGGLDNSIDLDDLKTKKCELAGFLTDDNGTFEGTVVFPKLRVNGFSINIADPDAIIERSFDLIGEDYRILVGKYFAYQKASWSTGTSVVVVLNPVPVEYAAGKFVFKVLRERAGVVSELIETTEYTFTGPATVTALASAAGDVIKVFYESATAYTTTWADSDTVPQFLTADSCEISMKVGSGASARVYRLQSLGIDVSFTRTDYKEIGNPEVVLTGSKEQTVKVSLDRYAEDFSLERVLAGGVATYPYINARDFAEDIQIQVLIYGEKEHTNFKIGYLMTTLAPTAVNNTQAVEDYGKRTTSLEGADLKISDDATELAFI